MKPYIWLKQTVPMLPGRPFISHNFFYKFVNANSNKNKRLFVNFVDFIWDNLINDRSGVDFRQH